MSTATAMTCTADELPDVTSRGWYVVNSFVKYVERKTEKQKMLTEEERRLFCSFSQSPMTMETQTVLVPEMRFLLGRSESSALAEAQETIDSLQLRMTDHEEALSVLRDGRAKEKKELETAQARVIEVVGMRERELKLRFASEECAHRHEKNASLLQRKLNAMIAAVGSLRAKEILAPFDET